MTDTPTPDDGVDHETPLGEQAAILIGAVTKLGEVADGLASRLDKNDQLIRELEQLQRRDRTRMRYLAASLVFDVLLSLGLGFYAHKATDASNVANDAATVAAAASQANAAVIKATCLAANDSRALNRQLWHFVLEVPEGAPQATIDRIGTLLAYVDTTFAARPCG